LIGTLFWDTPIAFLFSLHFTFGLIKLTDKNKVYDIVILYVVRRLSQDRHCASEMEGGLLTCGWHCAKAKPSTYTTWWISSSCYPPVN
jgi:hypothetical protein